MKILGSTNFKRKKKNVQLKGGYLDRGFSIYFCQNTNIQPPDVFFVGIQHPLP